MFSLSPILVSTKELKSPMKLQHTQPISMPTEITQSLLSAIQGNKLSQYTVGTYYADSDKQEEAFYFFKLAADQGHVNAQYRVAGLYEEKQNDKEAFRYYKLAADQGHLMALCDLAAFYEEGTGVEEDTEKAYQCYQLAADKGNSTAQYNVAGYYDLDDPGKAVYYYQLAAENTNIKMQAEAQYQLALHYDKGLGVEKNKKTAIRYCSLSAEQQYAPALCMLATYYLYGDEVEQDEDKAFRYYKLAVKKHEFEAHYWLGYCYEMGKGTNVNFTKAIYHYNLAAKNNSSVAKYALGICYLEEKGVKKDLMKAFNYFCQSSKDNDQAKYQVILCYARGRGVQPNRKKAFDLYRQWKDSLKIKPDLLQFLLFQIYECKPSKITEDILLDDYYLISKIYKNQEKLDSSSEKMKKRIEQINFILSHQLNHILTMKFSPSLFFSMLQQSDLSEVSPLIFSYNINTINQNINLFYIFFNQLLETVIPLPKALNSLILEYFSPWNTSFYKANTVVSLGGMFGNSAGKKRLSSESERDENSTNPRSVKQKTF